jgi:hypothetical protein
MNSNNRWMLTYLFFLYYRRVEFRQPQLYFQFTSRHTSSSPHLPCSTPLFRIATKLYLTSLRTGTNLGVMVALVCLTLPYHHSQVYRTSLFYLLHSFTPSLNTTEPAMTNGIITVKRETDAPDQYLASKRLRCKMNDGPT